MTQTKCPGCGGLKTIAGSMPGPDAGSSRFVPDHTRLFFNRSGVELARPRFRACLDCGLVWAAIDPARVRAFITEFGEEIARQQLDEMETGPFRDLPDTEWGRQIGGYISELDALARDGGPLMRRYRDI